MDDLYLFTVIVQQGGISAAAKHQSMQRSTVSRRLQELEIHFACKLLVRTTRQIELTPNGKTLYDELNKPFGVIRQVSDQFVSKQHSLKETLRIAVPVALIASNIFSDIIEQCNRRFPNLLLDIIHSSESIDMKRNNLDIQLLPYGKKIINEDYIQKSLHSFSNSVVASKCYIDNHSLIRTISDLNTHNIIVSRHNRTLLSNDVNIILCSDDLKLIEKMTKLGLGVAIVPSILVKDALQSNELVELFSLPTTTMTLIYPSKEFIPEKTQIFIQLMYERFKMMINDGSSISD